MNDSKDRKKSIKIWPIGMRLNFLSLKGMKKTKTFQPMRFGPAFPLLHQLLKRQGLQPHGMGHQHFFTGCKGVDELKIQTGTRGDGVTIAMGLSTAIPSKSWLSFGRWIWELEPICNQYLSWTPHLLKAIFGKQIVQGHCHTRAVVCQIEPGRLHDRNSQPWIPYPKWQVVFVTRNLK